MERRKPVSLSNNIDLGESLKDFDPEQWKYTNHKVREAPGYGAASKQFTGKGKNMLAITSRTDTRNNKRHCLKTSVEIEVFGYDEVRSYHYVTYFNELRLSDYTDQRLGINLIKQYHDSHRSLSFMQMKISYLDNLETDFSGLKSR
jgi:hypothetical protein